ncbi:putative bifunctional diguanylate cyclase/phosphodiesterase [Vibrio sp. HN007]|uniref:putative bifunctional diguanylate cyclase/phosphodiesterase n=1 Tax=Vibrio iocasae TaxID=3098914 RepID=UPI0035D4CB46
MKLSLRINIILLPVMVIIFSTAGFYSYNSQKAELTSSISEQIVYELHNASEKLYTKINEVDFLSKILLGSENINNYIYNYNFDLNRYYLEKQLGDYINQLQFNNSTLISFGIFGPDKKSIFYINNSDPFADLDINEDIKFHVNYIEDNVSRNGIHDLYPVLYKIESTADDGELLTLIRTFSPEIPITSTLFSKSMDLYTAVITVKLNVSREQLDTLLSRLGKVATFEIQPKAATHVLRQQSETIPLTNNEFGYTLVNDLWNITLSIPDSYLSSLYSPFKVLFSVIVLVVTIVTFVILKLLITRQIIFPVVQLTNKIENTNAQQILHLSRPKNDDEVSILTNKYIDLIQDLDNIARRDPLTGLPNRHQFNTDLNRFIEHCKKYTERCAVIYFDLDNFKTINDKYGHQKGDELLKEFAQQLVESYVDLDWDDMEVSEFEFARISGDEFTITLSGFQDPDVLSIFAKKILSLFDGGFKVHQQTYDMGASIGISVFPDDAVDATSLVKCADLAMYSAKNESKNGFKFYSQKLEAEVRKHEVITDHLKEALGKNQFELLYMPIYDCSENRICGAEALLRATSDDLIVYGPAEFIPVAEMSGVIEDIDYWVLDASLKQLANWIEQYDFSGIIAINFSSWQLKNPDFVQQVEKLINKHQVPAKCIELEITETCFVPGESKNLNVLHDLRKLGIKLSLDDFGTGYTAFSQLVDYPVDTLKIDRMFINEISLDRPDSRPIVDIIVEVAKLYDLNVVAEGVETPHQLNYIKNLGCQQAQGYLLSKPISADKFIELWQSKRV